MSDDLTWCVMGCTIPCDSLVCAAVGDHDHPPILRRADVGYLCRQCSDRLLREVAEIPDLYAQLPAPDEHAQGDGGEKVAHGKLTGSPALVNLAVLVLTDTGLRETEGDGVMPVAPMLGGWALIVEEELGIKAQSDTIVGYCDVFRQWHTRMCSQLWVDEYAGDIRRAWAALRRYSTAPRPLGRCWGRIRNLPHGGCGAWLYPSTDGSETIICPNPRCGRRYTGPDIVKLAIQQERDEVA